MSSPRRAFKLSWICRERGECPSDAGVSWHASAEDAQAFVRMYNEAMPSATPSFYLCPMGAPQEESCDKGTLAALRVSTNGVYIDATEVLDIERFIDREVTDASRLQEIDEKHGAGRDEWNSC